MVCGWVVENVGLFGGYGGLMGGFRFFVIESMYFFSGRKWVVVLKLWVYRMIDVF